MIKTSTIKYIHIKRHDYYQQPAIPTGQVREVDGERHAEFLAFMCGGDRRIVWLKRDEIY